MFQKPSIGRIVHYNNGGVVQPAIIVKVWNDTCVNLQVFTDGANDGPEYEQCPHWKTSVVLGDENQEGTWFWPPFVAPKPPAPAVSDPMTLARKGYAAYGAVTDFKNYQGLAMPQFDELTLKIQSAWAAAAGAIAEEVRKERSR